MIDLVREYSHNGIWFLGLLFVERERLQSHGFTVMMDVLGRTL